MEALRASQVLYIVALSLSKLSMALLILRIFAQSKKAAVLSIGLALYAVVWGVVASLASSIGCGIQHLAPTGHEGMQCSGSVCVVLKCSAVPVTEMLLDISMASHNSHRWSVRGCSVPLAQRALHQASDEDKQEIESSIRVRLSSRVSRHDRYYKVVR